jgi:hypothetical protein
MKIRQNVVLRLALRQGKPYLRPRCQGWLPKTTTKKLPTSLIPETISALQVEHL